MIKEHHPLTPKEVQKIAQQPMIFTKYQDLDDYESLDILFKDADCVLILFETHINSGHWCCLINQKSKIVFFDPYGLEPDTELLFTDMKFRQENDMVKHHLTNLLLGSKVPVEYSNKRLQKMSSEVQTCGYWCGTRMRFKDLSSEKFINLFKGLPRDEKDNAVIEIGEKVLGKI